ncbi:polysaccharide biosynthesis C-terminal domain-containing protein [Butyricimonas faecihominis]|jgi:hypothetical protein|uniref:polysaccharide biosynthesis C-terminal domain-containing protein n=1 Tax=Butyricimonas faecihominis TaxID=1472416 RepID=UPI00266F1237|nr:polysaccharide biosynthesis C-terminal domain-containing protein [Butyricimonas faecihominis]
MPVIDKRANRLLYGIDYLLIKSVSFVLWIIRYSLPTKWSELISKEDRHINVLNNVVGLTFFNALGGMLLLFTQIKLANYMGAALYGIYSYYLALGEVGANVVRYGRDKTMLRELVQKPEEQRSLITHTFILGLINLSIFMILVVIFHESLDVVFSLSTLLLILSPCLISLDFQPVYESLSMMSWHSMYYFLQKILFLFCVWGLLISDIPVSLFGIAFILFISWIFVLFLQYREITSQLGIHIFHSLRWKNLLGLYRQGFFIALSCLLSVAFGPLIRLVLNMYVDSYAVGVYAAGLQIYSIGLFLLLQIGRVGNPMMAELGKNSCEREKRCLFVRRYLLIMIACVLPFSIALFFFPDTIVCSLFTSEYVELSSMLPIFAIYLLVYSIGNVFIQFLIAFRKDKIYFTIFSIGAILTVLFAFILIPSYGVIGATLALCVPHGLTCLAYCIFSLKYL